MIITTNPAEQITPIEVVQTRIGNSPETTRFPHGTIFMYSGEKLGEQNPSGSWHCADIKGQTVEITMMERLAKSHPPMDAISVWLGDTGDIRWVKADGVSQIGQSVNNSGKLADWLARQVSSEEMAADPGKRAVQLERNLHQLGQTGYSTFEYGEIKREEGEWKIFSCKVGATRQQKSGRMVGGDLGPTETYYSNEPSIDYDELYNPSFKREFVSPDFHMDYVEKTCSGDLPLTLTTCTDGVRMFKPNGPWQNAGMVVERAYVESINRGQLVPMLAQLETAGYLHEQDDISLLSIHLPQLT